MKRCAPLQCALRKRLDCVCAGQDEPVEPAGLMREGRNRSVERIEGAWGNDLDRWDQDRLYPDLLELLRQ